MLPVERQQSILEQLNENGSVLVAELVERFNVSEMTIRRDLDLLERKGLLQRTRGGAISNHGRSYEPPFLRRSTERLEEKRRIGMKAASLVRNGESIMLDVGTTTLEVARNL